MPSAVFIDVHNDEVRMSVFFCSCSLLVRYTMSESVETWKGYIYAILMFLTAIANSLLLQMLFKLSYDAGGRATIGLISMVYKKVRITEIHLLVKVAER